MVACGDTGVDAEYRIGDGVEAELKTGGELFNFTSAARHPSSKGLGFATQDHSWCAFIGDFKTAL